MALDETDKVLDMLDLPEAETDLLAKADDELDGVGLLLTLPDEEEEVEIEGVIDLDGRKISNRAPERGGCTGK